MTYRGDDDAALRRRNELAQRLADETDVSQREALEAELAAIDRARVEAARIRLPMVARARIASPCTEAWDTMLGDGAMRSCSRCEKEVFDLSQMTLGQAEALIAARVNERICVRLFKRRDGTMMFADCEIGARGVLMRTVGAATVALVVGAAAMAYASAPQPPEPLRAPPSHTSPAALRQAGEEFLHPTELEPEGELPTPVSVVDRIEIDSRVSTTLCRYPRAPGE
jgi:hypothetical protein